MKVKCLLRILLALQSLTIVLSVPLATAGDGDAQSQSRVIGVIPISKAGVSNALYRHVDHLAPQLKKISAGQIVKLECRYNGVSSREKDVHRALMVAAEVERYLLEIHKIRINFWLTARFDAVTVNDPAELTFSLLSDDIIMLDKIPVAPTNSDAE